MISPASIIYLQVAVGDVIYIESNSGAVKRVGRSDAFATEFDLEAEEYVPLPKGEVHKKKEIVQVLLIFCFSTAQIKITLACIYVVVFLSNSQFVLWLSHDILLFRVL